MTDPRKCVPKGTAPLKYSEYTGYVHEYDPSYYGCCFDGTCDFIGFRVPLEMVSTFKHERSPEK